MAAALNPEIFVCFEGRREIKRSIYTGRMFVSNTIYIYNDRSVFIFVEKGEDNKITKIKIKTK